MILTHESFMQSRNEFGFCVKKRSLNIFKMLFE